MSSENKDAACAQFCILKKLMNKLNRICKYIVMVNLPLTFGLCVVIYNVQHHKNGLRLLNHSVWCCFDIQEHVHGELHSFIKNDLEKHFG